MRLLRDFTSAGTVLMLTVAMAWAQPANNNFADAAFLSGYDTQVAGSNVGANKQSGEPNHAGVPGGASVWWRWTAPATGTVSFSTLHSDFDTVLAVYEGSQLGQLGNVSSNDNSAGQTSAVAFAAIRGRMYLIAVDGVGGATGNVVLRLILAPSPANDLFANATVITTAALQTNGTLSTAGAEPGEPSHNGQGPAQSVWWRWTAPADGQVMVRKPGSSSYALAVYTGSSLASLQPVAASEPDSNAPVIYFNATAGTTYRIVLDTQTVSTGNSLFWFYSSALAPVRGGSPANVTVPIGGAASFRASSYGNPRPTQRWERKAAGAEEWQALADGPSFGGVTTTELQLTGVTADMGGDEFRCVFTNSAGSISSNVARLTVRPVAAPVLLGQLNSTIIGVPGKVVFSGADSGSPTAGYRWQRAPLNSEDWTDYATTPTFALTLPAASDFGYQYRAIADNSEGSAHSRAVVAGMRQSLAIFPLLEANTTLTIFGSLSYSELPPQTLPAVGTGIVAVAAGRSHVVALKSDGTVVGWGDSYGGSIPVPPDLAAPGADVRSLSTWYGTYAMRADGTARVWQGSDPNAITEGGSLATIMSQGYRLGLQENGTVFQIGSADGGSFLMDGPLTDAISAVGGYRAVYALHGNGTVSGSTFAAGNGAVPAGLSGVVALAVNDWNIVALKSDGTVVQWGERVPPPPADLNNVVAVATGYRHALALRKDGTVVAWGENPTLASLSQSLDRVVAIAAGSWNSAILRKNSWDVPVIVSHPPSRMLSGSASTLLYVGAVGPGDLTYQWYKDSLDNPVPGATDPSYLTPVLTSPTVYYARVTNSFGSAVSAPATIMAGSPPSLGVLPALGSQPASATVGYGQSGSVHVSGSPSDLAYQWFRGPRGDTSSPVGTDLNGYATPPLTENATYWVRVSNAAGSVNSQAAVLTVLTPSATWAAGLGLSGADLEPAAAPFPDGLPNLLRYALNLGAAPPAGQLPATSVEVADGVAYLKLQFRRRKTLPGVVLATQYSTDLGLWQDIAPENLTRLADDDADTERWQARLPLPPDGRLFLRLRATEN